MIRRIETLTFLISFLLFAAATAGALETESERYAVVIDETIGRFSIFGRTDDGERIPLYVATDPTTTYLSVLMNNRIYRLGDSFEFRQETSLTDDGAQIIWSSSRLTIIADIDISSTQAVLTLSVTNVSETRIDIGVRFLIDTYLGEDSTHFTLPSRTIRGETDVTPVPAYIQSGTDEDESFHLSFDAANATSPDRIILANWKRLDDTSWSYTVNTNRNFNVIPYSINDSAISLYYNPQTVAQDASRTVRVVFVDGPRSQPSSATQSTGTNRSTGTTTSSTSTSQTLIREDLSTVETLLDTVDRILKSGREPTDAEMREIQAAIEDLKDRRSGQE